MLAWSFTLGSIISCVGGVIVQVWRFGCPSLTCWAIVSNWWCLGRFRNLGGETYLQEVYHWRVTVKVWSPVLVLTLCFPPPMKWRTTSATHSVLHDSWLLQGTRVNESKSYGHKNIMGWDKINSSWIWHLLLNVINPPPIPPYLHPHGQLSTFCNHENYPAKRTFSGQFQWDFSMSYNQSVLFSATEPYCMVQGWGQARTMTIAMLFFGEAFGAPWSLLHRKVSHIPFFILLWLSFYHPCLLGEALSIHAVYRCSNSFLTLITFFK